MSNRLFKALMASNDFRVLGTNYCKYTDALITPAWAEGKEPCLGCNTSGYWGMEERKECLSWQLQRITEEESDDLSWQYPLLTGESYV